MNIGRVYINGSVLLAPMAGAADRAFRQVCRAHGAALSVSEMVSVRALLYHNDKTARLLRPAPNETPFSVQIFGHEPESMARGAVLAQQLSGCDIIDINMGCPAPKIVKNGDGSALMRDEALAGRIIEAVRSAVSVPVTVKFRLGWDEAHRNYLSFARMAASAGADAICVHGRTRSQQYSGKADWDAIGAVRQAVSVPVIANGDVFTSEDAVRMLAHTGADAVMIGRGSLGNPWIFERANAQIAGRPLPPLPPFAERIDTAVQQMELAREDKGEHIAVLEARAQFAWYLRGIPGAKTFKTSISQLSSMEELRELAGALKEAVFRTPNTREEG